MIKKFLEINAKYIARHRLLFKLFTPLIYFSNHIQLVKEKDETINDLVDRFLIKLLGGPVVKNGPFKGLVYPSYKSVGSAIFPKILGSYESELHPIIETLIQKDFEVIIDIGCAEGYYATGFALRNKNAQVYAYDTDRTARTLCSEMNRLNNVSERIHIEKEFTSASFKEIDPAKKTLIICDCEGHEPQIFNRDVLPFIKNYFLLIETHDFIDTEISINLQEILSNTHHLEIIESIDDVQKAKYYKYKELESLTIRQRKELLGEGRPAIMEWIIATPKNATADSNAVS